MESGVEYDFGDWRFYLDSHCKIFYFATRAVLERVSDVALTGRAGGRIIWVTIMSAVRTVTLIICQAATLGRGETRTIRLVVTLG